MIAELHFDDGAENGLVEFEDRDGTPWAVLTGEIDIGVAASVTDDAIAACGHHGELCIDVSDTTFIDATGLSLLVRMRDACGGAHLVGATSKFERILYLAGLDDAFPGHRVDDTLPPRAAANSAVFELVGDIDFTNMQTWRELGTAFIAAYRDRDVVIDMHDVTFLDSLGLGMLLDFRQLAARSGRRLALARVPSRIATLLEATGLNEPFGLDDV